jgi:hypothetical protein
LNESDETIEIFDEVVGFIAPNEIFEFGALDDAAGLTVPEVNNGCASNENDESTPTVNNG